MTNATDTFNFLSPEEHDESIRVALLVEYCGRAFHGSQFQPGQLTIQGALQQALRQLEIRTSPVSFASRTDAGVHAQGQVGHFNVLPDALRNVHLKSALNAVLPDSIVIRACHVGVSSRFHSRREAQGKWYRYCIHNGTERSSLLGPAFVHHPLRLDAQRMNEAARLLLGTHRFGSFQSASKTPKNDTCTVRHIEVTQTGQIIHCDIAADRFLYKMVRNLMGQLLQIGEAGSKLPPESILDVLAQRNRAMAVPPARPEGLCLMAVHYPTPFNYFALDENVQRFQPLFNLNQMESLQNENLFRKAS